MTDQPDGYLVVQKYGAMPFSADVYAVTFNPDPPPPDPEWEARKAAATMIVPASIARLEHLDDPTARAVLDLHRRYAAWPEVTSWECAECRGEGEAEWPCTTVTTVANVHGIDLTDAWLFVRPTDGSLDAPTPEA